MPKQTLEQWLALSPLLDTVLEMGKAERSSWIRTLDPELADQMEMLLREHEALEKQGFLEKEVFDLPASEPSLAGQTLGGYTLLREIGQGGMGSVWLAERSDGRFERRAAVKFLNIALDGQRRRRTLPPRRQDTGSAL